LGEETTHRFENEMVVHLNNFAQRHCEVIGEDGVREVIRLGLENSEQYGFTMQGPVRFFIELMFMFGSYFDTDAQYPWAGEALSDPSNQMELFRADDLHRRMTDYLTLVSGPENFYAKRALREIRRMLSEALPSTVVSLHTELMPRLQLVYPEKYSYLREDRISAVINSGISVGETAGVSTSESLRLFVILAFTLGHHFADDPLYPWIADTLNDPTIVDPNLRTEKVKEKALLYLDGVLGCSEKN
jgi:hypothetical protein